MTDMVNPNDPDLDDMFTGVAKTPATPLEGAGGDAKSSKRKPKVKEVPVPKLEDEEGVDPYDVFQRIGAITRKLHDALHELGYDKALESAVESLPDTRSRLSYIAKLTGEAAEKVLQATEDARSTQDELKISASGLKERWKGKTATNLNNPEGEKLVTDTQEYLGSLAMSTDLTCGYLTDIMMAQDFHDLTGQVIRRVVDLAQTLEDQLLKLLLETTPPDQRKKVADVDIGFLNGPVTNAEGRTDVVTDQSQVDDLLESLGF